MSTDGGSWAPFGPGGDDEERPQRREDQAPPPDVTPIREPDPEPAPDPEPPPDPEPSPAAAFQPPVAPSVPMTTSLNWPTPEPTPPPAPPPPPISQWPGAPHAPYGTPKRVASNATASLVLGIVGLVMCPLIASAAAIGLGTSAKREIRENPNEIGGESLATWGIALGWVGVAFGVLALLVFVGGLAAV